MVDVWMKRRGLEAIVINEPREGYEQYTPSFVSKMQKEAIEKLAVENQFLRDTLKEKWKCACDQELAPSIDKCERCEFLEVLK